VSGAASSSKDRSSRNNSDCDRPAEGGILNYNKGL
jgi:hypothetical protein